MTVIEHDRDPDARRPLTDAMTWGERQRLWMRVYKKERDRFEQQRDEARQQLQGAVEAILDMAGLFERVYPIIGNDDLAREVEAAASIARSMYGGR